MRWANDGRRAPAAPSIALGSRRCQRRRLVPHRRPLVVAVVSDVLGAVAAGVSRRRGSARHPRPLLAAATLVPLAALSLAPHQEPRFLLPLVLPLTLLHGPTLLAFGRRRAAALVACWLVYHLALTTFFSAAHQAGVVRALAHLKPWPPSQQATTRPRARSAAQIIFYRTYMPPRALLGMGSATPAPLTIVDLDGSAQVSDLADALRAARRRNGLSNRRGSVTGPARSIHVALPAARARELLLPNGRNDVATQPSAKHRSGRSRWWWPPRWCGSSRRPRLQLGKLERRLWPHWSAEDVPWSFGDAALELYRVA